jgi:putative N6-adenine-specific DNA methylase
LKPWTVHAIVPLGLETEAHEELLSLGVKNEIMPGHLSCAIHPDALIRLNELSRIPSRFLVIVGSFKATHFSEFKKKFAKIDFSPFLNQNSLEFKVHCKHCKLYHSGAIEERAKAVLEHGPWSSNDHGAQSMSIHIKGQDDEFTISVDSSGDHLYKRGILKHRGEAPIRENLAAAMINKIPKGENLWDPCCGSGTLLAEKILLETKLPLHLFRRFAFETWPSIPQSRLLNLRDQLLQNVQAWDGTVTGSDLDPKVLEAAQFNLEHLSKVMGEHALDVQFKVQLCVHDIAEHEMEYFENGISRHVISNPPYNERLQRGQGVLPSFQNISQHANVFILLPRAQAPQKAKSYLQFKNGGKSVGLYQLLP